MSLPAVTQLPHTDHLRIQALIKSLASGMIEPIELAGRAYRHGNESCHKAIDDLTESLPECEKEIYAAASFAGFCSGVRITRCLPPGGCTRSVPCQTRDVRSVCGDLLANRDLSEDRKFTGIDVGHRPPILITI